MQRVLRFKRLNICRLKHQIHKTLQFFSRFRKHFHSLPSSLQPADNNDTIHQNLSRIDCSLFSNEGQTFYSKQRSIIVELAESEELVRRDDYKEFAQLCLLFLNENQTEASFSFKRPGALHKARWIAKLTNSIKITLMEEIINNLPSGTIATKRQLIKIRDFVNFITFLVQYIVSELHFRKRCSLE